MNGAASLVKTLLANGVDTCFANPGTSEMHFVAALDDHPEMRCVLCLFEGGVTGAADGYARMSGKVPATLLHLAPGFGNGYANLHNARKAGSGIVNVVGDHADYHLQFESPLKGNVEGVCAAVSHWTRMSASAASVAQDGAAAITAARTKGGQIASLILPANTAWEPGEDVATAVATPARHRPSLDRIDAALSQLARPNSVLMIGRDALFGTALKHAGQIAHATGARLMTDAQQPRLERGGGAVVVEPLFYPVEPKIAQLQGTQQIVLCGTDHPVTFFAYPGKPSLPEPADCTVTSLCNGTDDVVWTLAQMAKTLGLTQDAPMHLRPMDIPAEPTGELSLEKVGAALAHHMPENTIIVNEAVTAGFSMLPPTLTARPHDFLTTTGGSIGQCLPCATGAAIACPDRRVLALTGDGSAMYTLQSMWTMAREKLDVTIVVAANQSYQILHDELANVGAKTAGKNAQLMFDLIDPALDWVALAKGHGVDGRRCTDMAGVNDALKTSFARKGPYLIELALAGAVAS